MQDYQRRFIEFALQHGALLFGEFVLKSGRKSPYFFNSGEFKDGRSLARLGEFYAAAIQRSQIEIDMLFGPAYKGIPLVAAVAIALSEHHDLPVPYCFNRKEAKDHGEGGITVGAPLAGRVLIVDDVISAGTSVREAIAIIADAGARACGVAISLDRQERGQGEHSAIQEVEAEHGLSVTNVIGLADLVEYLSSAPHRVDDLRRVRDYRLQYGVQPGP